jgi:hypothetical protein
MTRTRLKLTALLTLFYAAAGLLAQEVKYNYDRDINFAAYKSYRWTERERTTRDPLVDQDIRRLLEAQLAQKGSRRPRTAAISTLTIRLQSIMNGNSMPGPWALAGREWPARRPPGSTLELWFSASMIRLRNNSYGGEV